MDFKNGNKLSVPQTRVKTCGDRAFQVVAPKIWDALSAPLCFRKAAKDSPVQTGPWLTCMVCSLFIFCIFYCLLCNCYTFLLHTVLLAHFFMRLGWSYHSVNVNVVKHFVYLLTLGWPFLVASINRRTNYKDQILFQYTVCMGM